MTPAPDRRTRRRRRPGQSAGLARFTWGAVTGLALHVREGREQRRARRAARRRAWASFARGHEHPER